MCNKQFDRQLFERTGKEFPAGRYFEDLWSAYRLAGEARLFGGA